MDDKNPESRTIAKEAVSGAYSDAEKTGEAVQPAATQVGSQARDVVDEILVTGRQAAQVMTRQFDEQSFLTLLAGFDLGYIAGLLIHGRR